MLAIGSRIGHQRALFVSVLDSVPRTLEGFVTEVNTDWRVAVAELRAAIAAPEGDVVSQEMHAPVDRVLASFKLAGAPRG
jgi:hypothetical protein